MDKEYSMNESGKHTWVLGVSKGYDKMFKGTLKEALMAAYKHSDNWNQKCTLYYTEGGRRGPLTKVSTVKAE